MTEILARIRVKETAGIRRFLYPLTAEARLGDLPLSSLRLITRDGQPLPVQATSHTICSDGSRKYRLDFAVSLMPLEVLETILTTEGQNAEVPDPLNFTPTPDGGLKNRQARFHVSLDGDSNINGVVYDGIAHLQGRSKITRNGYEAKAVLGYSPLSDCPMAGWIDNDCEFDEEIFPVDSVASIRTEITACKSWVAARYWLNKWRSGDEIVFTLPLTVTAPTLTCDFGAGGGIYGKLDAANAEIIWRTEFDAENGAAKWTVENSGRVDYVGEAASRQAYLPQRWFHVVDSDKALAAAITHVPDACETLTVTLKANGDVRVSFTMGEQTKGAATFGVCWHFLNDVPAVAAATNPQSILLPPTVEVL